MNSINFWNPADTRYMMNKLAVMSLQEEPIRDRMNLGIPGYTTIRLDGKILYGSAWIDVTRKNMGKFEA